MNYTPTMLDAEIQRMDAVFKELIDELSASRELTHSYQKLTQLRKDHYLLKTRLFRMEQTQAKKRRRCERKEGDVHLHAVERNVSV
jgi:uncharacterized protein YdeI (YjbR/CyaY-like superfamily)